MKLVVLLLVLLLSISALGLDESSVKELRCLNVSTASNLDFTWLFSIKEWYFPIWSKLDIYRVASDVLDTPIADIPDSALTHPCAVCNSEFKCVGFNRPAVDFAPSFDSSGVITFKANGRKNAIGGTNTMTFTDNKNFVVGVACFDNDEASYEVWTPTPFISDKNKKLVKSHLVDLGFNMDYWIETSYENCPERNSGNSDKTEL